VAANDPWLWRGCRRDWERFVAAGLIGCLGCARAATDMEIFGADITGTEDAGLVPSDGSTGSMNGGGARSDDAGNADSGLGTNKPDADVPPDAGIDPAPDPRACASAAESCGSARDLGALSGDRGASDNWVEVTGEGSAWAKVRIREDRSVAHSLRVEARLQVSADSNYDLYLYRSDSADVQSCTNLVESSVQAMGAAEQAVETWDYETVLGNSRDDSRIITIEVRHAGGACGPWTLRVQGPL